MLKAMGSFALLCCLAGSLPAETLVYVSVAGEKKIAAFRVDPREGKLEHAFDTSCHGEPGALTTDPDRKLLFAALRAEGKLSAFRIDPATGRLKHLNTVDAGADPAHISTDRDGRFLLCAYYVAAKITAHAIQPDGSLSDKPAQSVPTADKAHAIVLNPSSDFVYVPHTGPNLILRVPFANGSGKSVFGERFEFKTPAKTGPRHLVFEPLGRLAYVVNEQGSSVTLFSLEGPVGELKPEQTISTLPLDFQGVNACAEIRLHPSGRFLYVSNRGHESIAGFRIGDSGRLAAIGHAKTETTPRSFDITPDGRFLYAAGESSGKLAAYKIDKTSGELERFATHDVGKTPWWVLAVAMPKFKETAAELAARGKTVLAKLEGEIKLPGLKEPVEVLRDRWGVAHIYAKNQPDLFFAQGFVAAQDRLFQIDLWRRQGMGEMAEAFGPGYLAADRFARTIRFRGDWEKEWSSYSPDTKEIATSFTRGINAGIDHFRDHLPIEFQLLRFRPKKWQPEDVVSRMSGVYMSQNFRNEIQRAQLVAAFGIEKARRLAPVDPLCEYPSHLPDDELRAIDKRILADYEAAVKALSFTPSTSESNNWVVSGARSKSGKPLLASDPHRAIALPSLRYLVHLHAPGWNVIGSGEPGLPGVALGHNDSIAWGFTIIGTDQADLFVEETHPEKPNQYRRNGKWKEMAVYPETIAVRGMEPRRIDVRWTDHGPVLFQDAIRNRAYVLRWVGSEPGGAAYLASLAVDRARNRKEFLDAMGRWNIPGLNLAYADVDGNIGWIAAARTPIRERHDGLLPVPSDAGHEWSGFLSTAELPQTFNPKEGWLATANHNIIPEGYRHQIGYEFAPPYRFQRIREVLMSRKQWELADFRTLQHDDHSLAGLALVKLLGKTELPERLASYRKRLISWDGKLRSLGTDEPDAGPLYALWLRELQGEFLAQRLDKEQRTAFGSLVGLPTMIRALETADPAWFGENGTATRDRVLLRSLEKAVDQYELLPDSKRRWRLLHTATFRHPLGSLDPSAARAFNVGPFGRTGDANTVNNTRYDDRFEQIHGASYRHLFDLADWDKGMATSAPGQSGQPGSRHYDDLAKLWAAGEYFPLAFSRKKVESVAAYRLELKP